MRRKGENTMIITEKELNSYLAEQRIYVTPEKKEKIMELFSTEPEDGFQWTGQDIYEQIRKLVRG